jgi:class 3 adenylate cyclase
MTTPRTLYAKSGDVHLAYQAIGAGERDIVLVLDWASHLEAVWEQPFIREFIASLNRYARVLWFDMRGVGLSDRVADPAGATEEWMDDVRAVMNAAGSERATLLAHGHGVQMALMASATYPERIESLVLINGFARFSRADDYPAGVPESAAQALLTGIEETWGTGVMAGPLGPSVASRPGIEEWYGRVERFAATPGTAIAKMRAILDLDVRNVLPLVSAPGLVVVNSGDAFVRAGHGRYLAEHLPNARLLERARPDHWPLPESDLMGAIEEFVTGARQVGFDELDRVLTTVLFVDVAGSTERASELGDQRWVEELGRFLETVRRTVVTHRGELVNQAGDGILATFDGPARAIRCARDIRDTMRRAGLDVRCGLHTGEVTRRNGDVTGIAVHIGARVSSAASPGEVLVTRTVRDLVAGSGIAFDDRGEHALKGVPERWSLYATSG